MSDSGTLLIVAEAFDEWQPVTAELSEEYGYRVLRAANALEAKSLGDDVHVDIVICEQHVGNDDALEVMRHCRIAHPYIIRILVRDSAPAGTRTAIDEAAIYQFIRRPLDPEQIGLVVKRALETRELARRHRLYRVLLWDLAP